MTALSSIETRYLLTIDLKFRLEKFERPTPYGERRIIHSGTGTFEGDGLMGTVPSAFGWTLIRNDDVWEINVRAVLQPHDAKDDLIQVSWMGLRNASRDVTDRLLDDPRGVRPDEYYFRITPYFETSLDGKYAWLNKICAVGIGEWPTKETRRLRIFQVL